MAAGMPTLARGATVREPVGFFGYSAAGTVERILNITGIGSGSFCRQRQLSGDFCHGSWQILPVQFSHRLCENCGADLAEGVHKTRPDLPVLFLSGYAGKELSTRGVELDQRHLLIKPVNHAAFVTRVHELLAEARTRHQE
jgi:FixJ family two-component response regulator